MSHSLIVIYDGDHRTTFVTIGDDKLTVADVALLERMSRDLNCDAGNFQDIIMRGTVVVREASTGTYAMRQATRLFLIEL